MKSRADIPITRDTVLQFGKHKGWTIGDCVDADPSYVIWLSEDEVMNIPADILEEAQENEDGNRRDGVDEWGNLNSDFWGLDFGDDD